MNTNRKFLMAIAIALLVFLVAACTGLATPIFVTLTPVGPIEVAPGEQQALTATVTGSATTTVTWSAVLGTIDANGNDATYTAPAALGSDTVTATSNADPSSSASVTIDVDATSVTYPGSYETMVFNSSPGRNAVIATVVIPQVADAVRYRVVGIGGNDPFFYFMGPITRSSPFEHEYADQAPSGVFWQSLSGLWGPVDSTAEHIVYMDSRFEDFVWEVTAFFE